MLITFFAYHLFSHFFKDIFLCAEINHTDFLLVKFFWPYTPSVFIYIEMLHFAFTWKKWYVFKTQKSKLTFVSLNPLKMLFLIFRLLSSAVWIIVVPLKKVCLLSLAACNMFSLPLVFYSFTKICIGVGLFLFALFGVCCPFVCVDSCLLYVQQNSQPLPFFLLSCLCLKFCLLLTLLQMSPISPPPPSSTLSSQHCCLYPWALHICLYVFWLTSSSPLNHIPYEI